MPNLRGNVMRHVNVRVRYLDRDGVEHDEVKRGLTAGTFQHECDHLDGVLFLDRVARHPHAHDVGAVRALSTATRSSSGSPSSSPASARDLTTYWCELAWLGGDSRRGRASLVDVDGDRITAVTAGRGRAARRRRPGSAGLTLPGLANAHSHAFHRALRGRTQVGTGSFWTWREQMYAPGRAARPRHRTSALATRHVRRDGAGRHHRASASSTTCTTDPVGRRTATRTRWARRWSRPPARGRRSGSRCSTPATSTAASASSPNARAAPLRRRRRAVAWAARAAALDRARRRRRFGSARRSTRCGPSIRPRCRGGGRRGPPSAGRRCTPTSASSRPRTSSASPPTARRRPALLDRHGALGERFTAVHATHLTDADIDAARRQPLRPCACCPTTERDLADGIGPARRCATPEPRAGPRHRLARGDRPVRGGPGRRARRAAGARGVRGTPRRRRACCGAATVDGHASLGWPEAGRLEVGRPRRPRARSASTRCALAGARPEHVLEPRRVRRARRPTCTTSWSAARWSSRDGRHAGIDVADRASRRRRCGGTS